MLQLRPYQQAAKAAVNHHLQTRSDNPLVVIPTGGGTTPVIASICEDALHERDCRVLIVGPSYNQAIQFYKKLHALWPNPAGDDDRKNNARASKLVVANIETVKLPASNGAAYDFVILVDVHLMRQEYDRAYKQLVANALAANSNAKVVGFAAMPYYVKTGPVYTAEPLCSPDGYLNHVCFEIGVRELIDAGVLTPVVTKAAVHQVETETLPLLGGDFDTGEAGRVN